MKINQTIFAFAFFVFGAILVLLFSASKITAQTAEVLEVENEREFEYNEEGEKGPRMWGNLKKEWEACKEGKMQSPIDICSEKVDTGFMPQNTTYKPFPAVLTNRGHDISMAWKGDAGSIFINGCEYGIKQVHWHSPSEHTINGKRYREPLAKDFSPANDEITYHMELHMVHYNKNQNVAADKVAVTSILYNIGKPDPFLGKLTKNISKMIDKKGVSINIKAVDPKDIEMSGEDNNNNNYKIIRYYRYIGSLTVPPCTEGVIWTIHKQIRTVSRNQIKLLREAVHDFAEMNARPLQQRNNREVYLYGHTD